MDLKPTRILPALLKVFEKFTSIQLNLHLKRYNVLPAEQFGFKAGYGCASALIDVVDDVIGTFDKYFVAFYKNYR